jgi:hypothetical protein
VELYSSTKGAKESMLRYVTKVTFCTVFQSTLWILMETANKAFDESTDLLKVILI